jgi:hypothetical protein
MGWVVGITPRPRLTPGLHWIGGWVCLRPGLYTEDRGKILCFRRKSNLLTSTLYWLSYPTVPLNSIKKLLFVPNCEASALKGLIRRRAMKGVTAEEHRFTGVCVLVSRLSDRNVCFSSSLHTPPVSSLRSSLKYFLVGSSPYAVFSFTSCPVRPNILRCLRNFGWSLTREDSFRSCAVRGKMLCVVVYRILAEILGVARDSR